ncbi:MAG: hypothetical protein JNJ45_04725 [Chthonomonas sp.]|nr:hypothetical protein [Chthonomonas sp.]
MNFLPVSPLGVFLFEPGEVTAGPLLISFIVILGIGILFMALGSFMDIDRKRKGIKYLSIPWFALAAWWGYNYWAYSQESIALKLNLVGGSSLTAYRVIFFGPLAMAIIALGFCVYWDKFRRDDEVF